MPGTATTSSAADDERPRRRARPAAPWRPRRDPAPSFGGLRSGRPGGEMRTDRPGRSVSSRHGPHVTRALEPQARRTRARRGRRLRGRPTFVPSVEARRLGERRLERTRQAWPLRRRVPAGSRRRPDGGAAGAAGSRRGSAHASCRRSSSRPGRGSPCSRAVRRRLVARDVEERPNDAVLPAQLDPTGGAARDDPVEDRLDLVGRRVAGGPEPEAGRGGVAQLSHRSLCRRRLDADDPRAEHARAVLARPRRPRRRARRGGRARQRRRSRGPRAHARGTSSRRRRRRGTRRCPPARRGRAHGRRRRYVLSAARSHHLV